VGVSDGARAATDVPEGGEGWSRDVRDAKRSRQFSNPRRVRTNHLAKTALIVVPLGAAVVSEPVPTSIRRPRLRASSRATRVSRAPRACRAAPPRVAAALLARVRSPRGLAASAGFLGGVSVPSESHHISDTPARDGGVVRPGPPRAGAMSNPDSVILEEEIDENYEPSQEGASEPRRRGGVPARGGGGPVETRSGARPPPRDSRPPPRPIFFPETATRPTSSRPRTPPPPRRFPPRPSGSDAPPPPLLPPPSLAPRHRTARFR
jgi:hypothetical protein